MSPVAQCLIAWIAAWIIVWIAAWIAAWINEWIIAWINEWIVAWIVAWIAAWIVAWINEWTNVLITKRRTPCSRSRPGAAVRRALCLHDEHGHAFALNVSRRARPQVRMTTRSCSERALQTSSLRARSPPSQCRSHRPSSAPRVLLSKPPDGDWTGAPAALAASVYFNDAR